MRARLLPLLLVASALAGCTGGDDGDNLDSQVEGDGWFVNAIYPDYSTDLYHVDSDPDLEDTDGDGVNDFQEFLLGADPRLIDTDRDRLADGPIMCPEAGSKLAVAVAEADILAHPDRAGCFLGEARWERGSMRIETKPTSAHTDAAGIVDDQLSDSEEIVGWDVTIRGLTHHVYSNPSFGAIDTDRDGLHDGNEHLHGLDPQATDTDGDGASDLEDAAPLGNLVLYAAIESINVKTDQRLTGGVRLKVVFAWSDQRVASAPRDVPHGQTQLGTQLRLDVPDTATALGETGGAGAWTSDVALEFYHDSSTGDEPIRVHNRLQGHRLVLRYDAFDDSWTGIVSSGSTSGPDADVKFGLDARIE